ncbi:hypothetical protein TNCV_885271 [Trichonephila clavipes]|nr:hypothetical protein TNCV_885271 [Trichonephila clavipes]
MIFYVVELLDDWNVDVPSWKYPRNLESPRVSSPGFVNDSKMMGKAQFEIVLTSTVGDLTHAENADMHYIKGHADGNGRAVLRIYHVKFPDQRVSNHRIFQWLHRQIRETRSFHVTRLDAGRRRAVPNPRLKESILNVVDDRSESSTKAVTYHV